MLLEVHGTAFATGVDDPELAVVILGGTPLAAVAGDVLLDEFSVLPAQAVGVVGHVEPVVDPPGQAAGLVLEVAPARAAFIDGTLLVADSVSVSITIEKDIVGIRFPDEDPIVDGEKEAGKHQIVRKDTMLVKDAVVSARPVHRDPTLRRVLVFAVDLLHVGVHLRDIKTTVAVEGHRDGFGDVGLAQDELHAIARGQEKGLLLVRRRERLHRRHRRKFRIALRVRERG